MANKVIAVEYFAQKAKRLLKKYPSLAQTLIQLENDLLQNPHLGVNYGANIYKIRIGGEGKGKSGGYQVITYCIHKSKDDTIINLVTLFTKAEEDTITKAAAQKLVKEIF